MACPWHLHHSRVESVAMHEGRSGWTDLGPTGPPDRVRSWECCPRLKRGGFIFQMDGVDMSCPRMALIHRHHGALAGDVVCGRSGWVLGPVEGSGAFPPVERPSNLIESITVPHGWPSRSRCAVARGVCGLLAGWLVGCGHWFAVCGLSSARR